MYTDLKSVQILISLLKSYDINHIVISPGTRTMPLTHSIERDSHFHCYSITDERSAGYFALGLIQQLKKPVAVTCTSGTAACNIIPATNEAKFQRLPLLVLTADRSEYFLDQYPDQMAPNHDLYSSICKKSLILPHMHEALDEWRCMITVNQALSELTHNIPGPVNINYQVQEKDVFSFNTPELPKVKKINRINLNSSEEIWTEKLNKIKNANKVLIVCGQHNPFTEIEIQSIERFAETFNCVFICDHISNFHSDYGIKSSTALTLSAADTQRKLSPDILITFGGHTLSEISSLMKESPEEAEHWLINRNGEFIDSFRRLTDVFECPSTYFFKYFSDNTINKKNSKEYLDKWKKLTHKFSITDSEIEYSDLFAVQQFLKIIPQDSLLHIANSCSIRYSQFFDIHDSINIYCNRGSNGIDGSMSTFIGASTLSKKLSFLLIGDLSFFYDMTALWNKYIGKNIRILLNNNSCGMLFYSNLFWAPYEGVCDYIAAGHNSSAKGWCESRGFKYLSATNKSEFDNSLSEFVTEDSESPILFEIFTDKDSDNAALYNLYKKKREITTERVTKYIFNKIKG